MAIIRFQSSSSFRLASFFTFLLISSVIIILYFISLAYNADLVRQAESQIKADMEFLRELDRIGASKELNGIIAHRIKENNGEYYYNHDSVGLKNIEWPKVASSPKEGVIQFEEGEKVIQAKVLTLVNGQKILIGRNVDYIEDAQDIVTTLGIAIILILSFISVVAYFVSAYVVKLINSISSTAGEIMESGDLSQRIPLKHERDDLSKLAFVLNTMFARVEKLVEDVRRVSDNIAHDLRTPLARLRNKLESFDGSAEEKEVLIKEADNLINVFNALLRIAKVEAGKEVANFEQIDLHELLEDVIELYEPISEDKEQEFVTSVAVAKIIGDRNLLFQAFANLVDNAIKFTPEKGKIEIISVIEKDVIKLKISDSGVGIPKEERGKVFSRFYRAEKSRTTSGHGLGLSLVQAVIEVHDGKIELGDNNPGLSVEIEFPIKA